ncbi:MAG: FtsQ-type POTRA domain-containing protein [Terracidiphilus sp.]
MWEDETPAEPRFRRVQQVVPPSGRSLTDVPPEMEDPDGDDPSRPGPRGDWQPRGSSKKDSPRSHWWRPASKAGRVLLLLAVLAVLGSLATSAYLLKTWVGSDGRFRIDGASNIKATGLTEVSRADMLPVFGEDIGRNIFFVPLSERRRQLEEIPWIQSATVMRVLPDQIHVSVVERQPVAFTRQGQQIGLVDANGILLSMPAAMMAQHHYSFPVVTGIDSRDPSSARKARMAVYQRLLADLDAGGQKISTQISEVDLTDPEDARVIMQDDTTLLHFGQDQFLVRYQRYKAHIAEWRHQYPSLAAVDLRYDQQVVLEMAAGTDVAQAAAGEQSAANGSQERQPALKAIEKGHDAGKSLAKHVSETKVKNQKSPTHPSRPTTKAKPGKASAKPASNGSAKAKTAATKNKAAKAKAVKAKAIEKKRAEVKRTAQNQNRQKIAPINHSAAPAAMGQ